MSGTTRNGGRVAPAPTAALGAAGLIVREPGADVRAAGGNACSSTPPRACCSRFEFEFVIVANIASDEIDSLMAGNLRRSAASELSLSLSIWSDNCSPPL